jgi:hypothetical protein
MQPSGFRDDLEPIVKLAEAEILRLVRQVVSNAKLERIGPLDFGNGASWSCWIVTTTDAERDRVAHDEELLRCLDAAASNAGFAPSSFTVQSQETVDRDYEGSWFYAMR